LDAAIHLALDETGNMEWYVARDGEEMIVSGDDIHGRKPVNFPKYTTSLDAAIALCERVLPEGTWSVDFHRAEKCYAGVRKDDWTPPVHGYGISPATALCIAILKALSALEGGK